MKRRYLFAIIVLILFITGCKKLLFDLPSVSSPVVDNVIVNDSTFIGFEIFTDAGYNYSEVYADKGQATLYTNIGKEAVQGLIYVKYVATSETGKDYITFTVKDNNGNKATSTIEVLIVENE